MFVSVGILVAPVFAFFWLYRGESFWKSVLYTIIVDIILSILISLGTIGIGLALLVGGGVYYLTDKKKKESEENIKEELESHGTIEMDE